MGNWIQTSSAGPQTGGGVYAPLLPASVSASENTALRTVDPNTREPIDVIDVTITRQTDDRAEWFDGWLYDPAVGWGGSEGRWKVGDTVRIYRKAPPTTTSGYKVRFTTGSSQGENDPANAVESGAFSLTGVQRPAASGVSIVTPGAFSVRSRPDGSIYAYISPFTWQDPTADVWAFFTRITVQVGRYISGVWTPAPGRTAAVDEGGDEIPHAGTQVTGGSHSTNGLALDFNAPGSLNNIVKFRFYLQNRLSTSEWDFTDTNKTRYQLDYDVSITPIAVSSVALSETGSRSINASQETFSTTRTTVAVSVNPATLSLTLWHSYDNGTTWDWIGWFDKTGTSGITLDVVHAVPLTAGTWKAAVAPRQVGRTSTLPADAVVSSAYAMPGLSAPAASSVHSASVSTPVLYRVNEQGIQYWGLEYVKATLNGTAGAAVDVYAWTTKWQVRKCNIDGSVAAPDAEGEWRTFAEVLRPITNKEFVIPIDQWTVPADPTYSYFQFRIVLINRNETSTIATCWGGGATASSPFQVLPQGRTLKLTAASPETIGVVGDGRELLVDCGFEFSAIGPVDGTPGKRRWYPNSGSMAVAAGAGLPAGGGQYASVPYVQYAGALQFVPVRVGYRYLLGCWARSDALATQPMRLYVDFYSDNGDNLGSFAATADLPCSTTWQWYTLLSLPAPSGASWARTIFAWQPSGSGAGAWWIDGCSVTEAVDVGPGLHVNASGGLQFSAGLGLEDDGSGAYRVKNSAYIEINEAGEPIIKPASISSDNLAPSSLGDLSKYSSSVRAVSIVFGEPSLPNTLYPNGSVIFDLSVGYYKANTSGVWKSAARASDIIAGTLASGVSYSGVVNAGQVNGGQFLGAAYTMVNGDTTAKIGAFSDVNFSLTAGLKVSSGSSYLGVDSFRLKCSANYGNDVSEINPGGFYHSVSGDTYYGRLQLGRLLVSHGLSTASSAYWNYPLVLGNYYIWVDAYGRLRIKLGAPTSDLDGGLVGLQA
jgi:hypothetical protein